MQPSLSVWGQVRFSEEFPPKPTEMGLTTRVRAGKLRFVTAQGRGEWQAPLP
jgi:hypothetical protein